MILHFTHFLQHTVTRPDLALIVCIGTCIQGYVACSLLLSEHQDLLRLIIQAIKNDLAGKNEVFQCLSLVCIANVGGQEFAEALAPDVQKLLVAGYVHPLVH